MKKRRSLNRMNDTKKREILGEIARGLLTVKEAGEKYKITTSAIYYWRKQWGFEEKDPPMVTREKKGNGHDQEVLTATPVADAPQLKFDPQRALYELRISQLEHENRRLGALVEALTDAIGEFTSHAE